MWCVYDHPLDYPHCYVAREWLISTDGRRRFGRVLIGQTFTALRTLMPPECDTWIDRSRDDDPCILGTWI
jgi:hypothetical protein